MVNANFIYRVYLVDLSGTYHVIFTNLVNQSYWIVNLLERQYKTHTWSGKNEWHFDDNVQEIWYRYFKSLTIGWKKKKRDSKFRLQSSEWIISQLQRWYVFLYNIQYIYIIRQSLMIWNEQECLIYIWQQCYIAISSWLSTCLSQYSTLEVSILIYYFSSYFQVNAILKIMILELNRGTKI